MDFLRGNSDVLELLVMQMYTRGLSTRDIEEAFRDPLTGQMLLGRTVVSELTDSLRMQAGLKQALLAAWVICRDGRKVLLHMQLGNKDSLRAWRHFLRDMVKRGLPIPTLVATDGAPALLGRDFVERYSHLYPSAVTRF